MQQSGSIQSATAVGVAKIASEQVCVVYHANTGNIVHVHRILNLEGAKTREAPEIEARAVELALSLQKKKDRSKMKTLMVPPEEFTPPGPFKVDLRRKRLVAKPSSTRNTGGRRLRSKG
jgi:hypothetical protein